MVDTMSKKNKHEASFMIALCNHLVKNGYPPNKITVLATYSGQMFYMKKEQNNYDMLTDVAITGVDNFQGEENDIILLSLVRSNEEGSIGFLSSENRVCVALSRAKKGFFIIGNMELLSRHSKLWDKIKQQLYEDKAIGQRLTLRCEAHLDQISQVATSEDFAQYSPEGGCLQTCDKVLGCGHVCLSKCHGYDHEHQGAKKCAHPCERIPPKCNMLHKCLKLCSEWCGDCLVIVKRILLCGHVVKLQCGTDYKFYKCKVQVKVTLPLCGHLVAKPCHQDIDTVICSLMCETFLSCDHKCILKCHLLDDPDHILYKCTQPCTKLNKNCTRNHTCARMCSEPCGPCTHKVKKTPPGCDHSMQVLCGLDPAEIRCEKKCEKILPCGHICPRRCIDECGGCPVQVEKVVSDCGHNVKVKCYHTPTTKDCTQPCVKMLVCGHPCTTRCCDVCTTRCTVMVQSLVNPACKHDCPIDIPCFLQALGLAPNSVKILSYCGKQCEESLECKHTCRGTCGECMQGRVHVPCQETCNRRLICGHRCVTLEREQCPSSCEHSSCSRRCFEPCDREPCDQPCQNNLRCGHKCVGFCGDPCPPECRICDRHVSEVFKEFADDHEARFVLLECKHTVESRQLKKWLNSSGVSVKVCPQCNRPVTKSIRYKDLIKECYSDICKVRNHIMEQTAKMEKSRDGLRIKLDCLNLTNVQDIKWIKDSEDYKTLWKSLVECLTQDRRTQKILGVRMDTETVSVLVEIITELVMSVRDSVRNFTYQQETTLKNQLDLILHVLAKQKNKISTQETQDLNLELKYFQRMIQFFNLESTTAYEARKNLADVTAQHSIAEQILSSDDKYSLIKDQKLNIIMQNFAKALNPASFMPYEVKKTITKNTGFREGCWYKCTNGHINAVQDFNIKRELEKCSRCALDYTFANEIISPIKTKHAFNNLCDGAKGAREFPGQNCAVGCAVIPTPHKCYQYYETGKDRERKGWRLVRPLLTNVDRDQGVIVTCNYFDAPRNNQLSDISSID
ncbi:unnamed protein product [Timema podura]|uniref:DNA2/NAM7 helicase-like C-terminal domain-containing protein n=1 Tax=Timema podura TaxID=61482 RepID=A0ABN7NHG2_TIMPD|nr:unnamed protein product [Timema podura]